MAWGGLSGTEIAFSSVNNKVDSMPPGEEENGPSYGLFTLHEPSESTVPEMEYVCPNSILLKAKLNNAAV